MVKQIIWLENKNKGTDEKNKRKNKGRGKNRNIKFQIINKKLNSRDNFFEKNINSTNKEIKNN